MHSMRFFIALIFICCGLFSKSQTRNHTTNLNGWYSYTGTHKFAPRWSLHLEVQFRRHELITNPMQLMFRTGINYHFFERGLFGAGYLYADTYPYGEQPVRATFPEHRIWQQLQFTTPLGRVEWVSRFRNEQRFLNLPVYDSTGGYVPGEAVYVNRVRVLNRFSIPFSGKTIEDNYFYFTVYDELFISFGKNVALNIFDQNRACASLGYKIPKLGRVEVGYLHQLILKADGVRVENNHTVQVAILSTLPFRKM